MMGETKDAVLIVGRVTTEALLNSSRHLDMKWCRTSLRRTAALGNCSSRYSLLFPSVMSTAYRLSATTSHPHGASTEGSEEDRIDRKAHPRGIERARHPQVSPYDTALVSARYFVDRCHSFNHYGMAYFTEAALDRPRAHEQGR